MITWHLWRALALLGWIVVILAVVHYVAWDRGPRVREKKGGVMGSKNGKLRRHGKSVQVVEFRCPRCKRGLLLTKAEAQPPQPGLVPYCQDCLMEKCPVQMVRRAYRSGPTDLHV
jgi:hypothetical protein